MSLALTHYKILHKMPEVSGKEIKTSQYIYNTLNKMGYTPHLIGGTSVYADLVVDSSLPWILLRADIDALPINENSGLSYSSQNVGVMHACGHDAHTAMLLETISLLSDKKLPHNIRFLFQSAEETTKGAAAAIADGVIPNNLIASFAMHVWPQIPLGTIATKSGPLMASSDVFRIKFFGKSCHCSQQNLGHNALLSAVDMAAALPYIKSTAADDNTLLFCGSINSGDSHNIVPDKSELYGTIRTYSTKYQDNIKQLLKNTANDIATRYGTTAEVTFDGGCPPVCNDERIVLTLINGDFNVNNTAQPTLAAEDFSYYSQFAPSVMLWLGIGNTPPLHNEAFFVPQESLTMGVQLWIKIATHNWQEDLK